jgi:hypothetical protein
MRIAIVLAWLLWALWTVGTVLAQDGTTTNGQPTAPDDVDTVAARLMPLLVGAALIERMIEFLFNWVERALLDASHALHSVAIRATGLVQIDLRGAWLQVTRLTDAMSKRSTMEIAPEAGNINSPDPVDWPLASLQKRLEQTQISLQQAETLVETALKSPQYVARKKTTASVLSIVFGIFLASITNMRLFEPIGVDVADRFRESFDWVDLVLAGILMGLGTDWVHQVIGLLIKGKGFLGRAAGGDETAAFAMMDVDPDSIQHMAELAVQQQLEAQFNRLRNQAEQAVESIVTPEKPATPTDDSPG